MTENKPSKQGRLNRDSTDTNEYQKGTLIFSTLKTYIRNKTGYVTEHVLVCISAVLVLCAAALDRVPLLCNLPILTIDKQLFPLI